MIRILVVSIASTLAGMVPQIAEPAMMTRMKVQLTGPGIRPGSRGAAEKVIYRAGRKYARLEDARQKITIIAEPDAYSIDLAGKVGTHAIDQGGPNDLHLPIVLPFDPNHQLAALDRLEFGDELDFFSNAGATKNPGPTVNGKATDTYSLDIGSSHAELVTYQSSDIAVSITWTSKEGTYRYKYTAYDDIPFDLQLFSPPAGIKLREFQPLGANEEK